MVKRFIARANGRWNIFTAATLLASSTLAASLIGLYRDRLLLGYYYDTYPQALDAYRVAFTIPDFMFFILVSGALSVTFIPVFTQRMSKGNSQSAWELSSSLLNMFAVVTFVASLAIIIFAEPLVRIIASGLDESTQGLAVSMMRVIAINPFLFSISSVLASIQQAMGRYFFFALAPLTYNLGIIFGILVLTNGINLFGWQVFGGGIMGVALGVVLGSIVQLIVSSIGVTGLNFTYQFKIFWRNLAFRRVLKLLPPRAVDQGIDYFNNFVEINLASRLGFGAIATYQMATTLYFVPISLIGVAISTAVFPHLTRQVAAGRPDLFKKQIQDTLRVIMWLALPVSAFTFLARGYIVSFVKFGGASEIANVLGVLAVAILFRSVYLLISRSFYAQQNTRTPLYVSLVAIALNIVLAITFVTQTNLGVFGLAAAHAITTMVEVIILFTIMTRHGLRIFDARLADATLKMISATGLMFVVTYIMLKIFSPVVGSNFVAQLPPFIVIVAVSGVTYLAASRLLHIREAYPVIERLKMLVFFKRRPHA